MPQCLIFNWLQRLAKPSKVLKLRTLLKAVSQIFDFTIIVILKAKSKICDAHLMQTAKLQQVALLGLAVVAACFPLILG